jgi:hypothetical protein
MLTLVCLCCGDTLRHVRSVPSYGLLPELQVFVCPSCNAIETKRGKWDAQVVPQFAASSSLSGSANPVRAAERTWDGAEAAMRAHKFSIGQNVHFRLLALDRNAPNGKHQIIGFLPRHDDGEFGYRIRRLKDGHQLQLRSA